MLCSFRAVHEGHGFLVITSRDIPGTKLRQLESPQLGKEKKDLSLLEADRFQQLEYLRKELPL
jgi:hypothetical protein